MEAEGELMEEIQKVEEALKEENAKNNHLKQQTDVRLPPATRRSLQSPATRPVNLNLFLFQVFTAVPEKAVVFKGSTGEAADTQPFEMTPRVVYPMEEGTALITFEEEVGESVRKLPPVCLGTIWALWYVCYVIEAIIVKCKCTTRGP